MGNLCGDLCVLDVRLVPLRCTVSSTDSSAYTTHTFVKTSSPAIVQVSLPQFSCQQSYLFPQSFSQNILLSFSYFLEGPVVVRPSTLPSSLLRLCYSFPFGTTILLPRNDFTTTILPLRGHLHATFEFVKSIGLLSPPTNHKSMYIYASLHLTLRTSILYHILNVKIIASSPLQPTTCKTLPLH